MSSCFPAVESYYNAEPQFLRTTQRRLRKSDTEDPETMTTSSAAAPIVFGWQLLRWIGAVFFVLGLVNLGIIVSPLQIGNPDWEFGTVNAFLDALPLSGLGLGLVLSSGRALGNRWLSRFAAVTFIVLALVVWGSAALYATNVPLAFKSIKDPAILTVIKKAASKATVQALVYPFGFLWLAIQGWKGTGHSVTR